MKYFHTKTLRRRNFNKIYALKVDGDWCFDDEVLQHEAISFFKSLYSLIDQRNVLFAMREIFPRLDMEGLEDMARVVTVDEIRIPLFSMGPLKALRSDGFHALFYQNQ